MGETPNVVMPWRSIISQSRFGRGIIRRAVVQENRAAEEVIAQDAPRPHHPADIGEPEEAVVGLMVEGQPDFLARLGQACPRGCGPRL